MNQNTTEEKMKHFETAIRDMSNFKCLMLSMIIQHVRDDEDLTDEEVEDLKIFANFLVRL